MIGRQEPLLEVKDLEVQFHTYHGVAKAVNGVSFHVDPGETLAIVGESGSGKSVTSLTVVGLAAGGVAGGEILFRGENLLTKSRREMRRIRGNEIAMIFQEPMTSLNPVYTVGWQIVEAIQTHQDMSRRRALGRAEEMLELVGIPEPRARLGNFPHQLSGGMRQRVMIAMALSCNPRLLIADEPTTALDVTIQAQILDLMRELQQELGMSILFITHDLAVVSEMADRVVVMYAGRAVEEADARSLFTRPLMPYTRGLLGSIPGESVVAADGRLATIPGDVPNPVALPPGCPFHPRCAWAHASLCDTEEPRMEEVDRRHLVRCLRWREIAR
jgi:oligopeptide transport system ATP-binding protein